MDRSVRVVLGVVFGVALLVGCGTSSEDATASSTTTAAEPSADPTTVSTEAPPQTTQPTTQPAATPSPPAPVAASWVMPNLVGQTLQQAQDEIQRLTDYGVFFTSSSDATGQDRAQLVDSNWLVCAQSVAPGATITAESRIEFSSVKLSESCP